MEESEIREAWDECELEELEQFNGTMIDPAVFEPQMDGEFIFEEQPCGELWESVKSMDGIAVMDEPLDGYLKSRAYVTSETSDISINTYSNRIKISPANEECTYEAFKYFINQFEEDVCELEFLGGLDEMNT